MSSKILFITWDGPQTNYLEGLFLPIFKRLANKGHSFHVLQFTWADAERIADTCAACEAAGVPYRSAKIWRKAGGAGPFSSAIFGRQLIKQAVRDWHIDTLMPRSLMPALAVLAMGNRGNLRLVFDADGFSADERVDFAGLSKQSLTYRILRKIEARTTQTADRVLVRTPRAVEILLERSGAEADPAKFHVVSNGRDVEPYLTCQPERNNGNFRLCYAGSLGAQYCPDQMVAAALALKAQMSQLVFRVFTGDGSPLIAALDRARVRDREWIEFRRLPPEHMPGALMACDLAFAFRRPAFSTQGVAPIKLGEYMLAGLPIIGSPHVGNVDELIRQGVFLPSDGQNTDEITRWVVQHVFPARKTLRNQCVNLGQRLFSIDKSVTQYMAALEAVPASPSIHYCGGTA